MLITNILVLGTCVQQLVVLHLFKAIKYGRSSWSVSNESGLLQYYYYYYYYCTHCQYYCYITTVIPACSGNRERPTEQSLWDILREFR